MKVFSVIAFIFLFGNLAAQKSPDFPPARNFDTTIGGKKVALWVIENKNGYKAAITNFGGKMVGMWVKDKKGNWVDVVPGYDHIRSYVHDKFSGALIGRFANRIAKGKFVLDGKEYQLPLNNGENTLHSGPGGFHSVVWDAKRIDRATLQLDYFSKDGEQGFPGNMNITVVYSITDKNELSIKYKATTDKRTIINLTNHNYWNLNGEGNGSINKHKLQILASKYTPVDETLIPTGVVSVVRTPFDFRKPRNIGDSLKSDHAQLVFGKGYDHNFALDKGLTQKPRLSAIVTGDKTGIVMKVFTTEPGIQFYGGNFMNGKNTWKNGTKGKFRTAFALETQHFPDSPNHPDFPSTLLNPGKTFRSETIYKFG